MKPITRTKPLMLCALAVWTAALGATVVQQAFAANAKQAKLQAKITEAQAKAIALKEKPGTVTEIELENEDGVVVYSVDITAQDGKKHEVVVDANSGKVLNVEADNEADGDKDDEADDDGEKGEHEDKDAARK